MSYNMACMYSQYIDSGDRTLTPMISGIRIGDNRRDYYRSNCGVFDSGMGSSYHPHPHPLAVSHRHLHHGPLPEMKIDPDTISHGGFCSPNSAMMSSSDAVANSSVDSPQSNNASCNAINASARNRKAKEDKICGVCGDKALGFNFDAISCESCKAFFRRNAPKGLGYFKCPYDEKCKMDLSNRRFCKRCRLKKCFEIGMRKEYILSEEEKAQKRQKIEDNRYLRRVCGTSSNSTNKSNNSTNHRSASVEHERTPSERDDHSDQNSQSNHSNPSTSPSCPTPAPIPVPAYSPLLPPPIPLTPIPPSPSRPVHSPHLLPSAFHRPAILHGFPCAMPPLQAGAFSLSSVDGAAIYDLHVAYANSLEVSIERDVSRDEASFSDLVNIAELSVRRVIAMAKQVPAFKCLPQVEQIHLLKGGSIELLILRSVITFDKEKQHFLDPLDQEETKAMKLEQLERAENGTGLFEDHMKFVKSLAFDLGADDTVMILLLVISLFSPDRDNLEHRQLVANEQERYSMLLKSYLDSVHPPVTSRQLFPKLLMKLTDIRNLNEEHSQVLLKVNPEGIQPLMKEVLDLTC